MVLGAVKVFEGVSKLRNKFEILLVFFERGVSMCRNIGKFVDRKVQNSKINGKKKLD